MWEDAIDDSHLVGLPDPARAGAADKEFDSDPARENNIGGRNFFLPPIHPILHGLMDLVTESL